MFFDSQRCHLCAFKLKPGEMTFVGEVIEIYNLMEEGYRRRLFKSQWHVQCALEAILQ
jgi:hypothetical protein